MEIGGIKAEETKIKSVGKQTQKKRKNSFECMIKRRAFRFSGTRRSHGTIEYIEMYIYSYSVLRFAFYQGFDH